jgi:hypothetical protein
MSERLRLALLMFLATMLLLTAGCSSWNIHKVWPWNDDDKPQPPTKVVAVWTDTVKYGGGGPAVRGFGGRLMFYATEKGEPVKVEGTLVVYAFDETNRKLSNAKPDRKYVYTPEQLSDHYSKSKLGHSYSVWIPWGDAMGPQAKISLIVRFVPEDKKDGKPSGGVLVGEQCTQILPGSKPEVTPPASPVLPAGGVASTSEGVRTVSHEIPVGAPQPAADPICNVPAGAAFAGGAVFAGGANLPGGPAFAGGANLPGGGVFAGGTAYPGGPIIPGGVTTSEMPAGMGHVRTTTIYVPPRSNLNQPDFPVANPSLQGSIPTANPMAGPNGYPATLNRQPGALPMAPASPLMNPANPATNPAGAAPPQALPASSSSYAPGMCPPNFSAWQPPRNSLSTHFEQARFRAPGEAVAPPTADRGLTTPLPAGSPFAPAPLPQSVPNS